MRRLALLLAIPLHAACAQSAPPSPSDRAAIEHVITEQLQAFRRDDGVTAFGDASPRIRAVFHDPATFLDMVREGYQPVYRSRAESFGVLEQHNGALVQHVELTGPDGADVTALYDVERETDGSWLISGCTLVKVPQVGA